jgi:hypothetical protein
MEGYEPLPASSKDVHLAATAAIALTVVFLMAPAAYHRIVEQGSVSLFFVKLTSWMIAAAMVPLAIALSLEVYLVGTVIMGERGPSAIVATVLFVIFAALWFAFPFAMRQR